MPFTESLVGKIEHEAKHSALPRRAEAAIGNEGAPASTSSTVCSWSRSPRAARSALGMAQVKEVHCTLCLFTTAAARQSAELAKVLKFGM